MRLLVCGSRDWNQRDYLFGVLDGIHTSQPVQVLIEGEAGGADTLAKEWAEFRHVRVLPFPAHWELHKPKDPTKKNPAGVIRNRHMLSAGRPELVVAFWKDKSPGTRDMIEVSGNAGIEVYIFTGLKESK